MSQHAIENAQSWFQTISAVVSLMEADELPENEYGGTYDELLATTQDSVLSIQVRSGWHNPGDVGYAAEYELLLTTGGPALRIVGELDGYCHPENARLQWQDWGTPWTDVHMSELLVSSDITPSRADKILLSFAGVFYFGE